MRRISPRLVVGADFGQQNPERMRSMVEAAKSMGAVLLWPGVAEQSGKRYTVDNA